MFDIYIKVRLKLNLNQKILIKRSILKATLNLPPHMDANCYTACHFSRPNSATFMVICD